MDMFRQIRGASDAISGALKLATSGIRQRFPLGSGDAGQAVATSSARINRTLSSESSPVDAFASDTIEGELVDPQELQGRGWIRCQVLWMTKHILQLGMGDAYDDWLIARIQWLRKEEAVASGIYWLKGVLWPDDKAPATLVRLIGKKQYTSCAKDIYYFSQATVCMKQLAYSLLEMLLLATFAELHDLVLDVRSSVL